MAAVITGILAAGLLALLASLALLLGFGFERFVGTRYLRREAASRVVRLGPYVALAITALDLLVILATRNHHRTLETFAVVIALVAPVGLKEMVNVCSPLGMSSGTLMLI